MAKNPNPNHRNQLDKKALEKNVELQKEFNRQSEKSNITAREHEVLADAILQATITTVQEITEYIKKLEKGGANAQQTLAQLESMLAGVNANINEMNDSVEKTDAVIGVLNDSFDLAASMVDNATSNGGKLTKEFKRADSAVRTIQKSLTGVSNQVAKGASSLEPFAMLTEKIEASTYKLSAIMSDTSGIVNEITNDSFDLSSSETERSGTLSESLKILTDQVKLEKESLLTLEDKTKELEKLLKSEEILKDYGEDYVAQLKDNLEDHKQTLKIQKVELEVAEDKLKIVEKHGSAYKSVVDGLNESAQAMQSSIDSFMGIVPGGDWLSKQLGLDKIGGLVDKHLNESFSTFISQVGLEGVSSLKAMTTAARGFGKAMWAALGPWGILAGIVVGLLIALNSVHKAVHGISEEMGVSHTKAKDLYKQSLAIQGTLANRLSTQEDILGVMTAMTAIDGLTHAANDKTIGQLGDMTKALGLSAGQAADIHDALGDLGASDEAAVHMAALAVRAGEAAGFTGSIITDDIIAAAEDLAGAYYGMPQDIVLAAIETRKLGLSLKQAASMADSMLDIESSLTAQFEASAALNRNINFDKARQLFLDGKMAEGSKAAIEALGTKAQFEEMGFQQKKLAAKAFGLEVSELANMYDIQEKTNNLTADQIKLSQKYSSQIKDIGGMEHDAYVELLGHLDAQDQAAAKWNKIKTQLMKAIMPLLEIIGDLIMAIIPILEPIAGLIKLIGMGLKKLMPILKGILIPFQLIGAAIETIVEFFDGSVESGTAMNKTVDDIGHNFEGLGQKIMGGLGLFIGFPLLMRGKWGKLFKFISSGAKGLTNLFTRALGFGKLFKGGAAKKVAAEAAEIGAKSGFSFWKMFKFGGKGAVTAATATGVAAGTALVEGASKPLGGMAKAALESGKIASKGMTSGMGGMAAALTKTGTEAGKGLTTALVVESGKIAPKLAAVGAEGGTKLIAGVTKTATKESSKLMAKIGPKLLTKKGLILAGVAAGTLLIKNIKGMFKGGVKGEVALGKTIGKTAGENLAKTASKSIPAGIKGIKLKGHNLFGKMFGKVPLKSFDEVTKKWRNVKGEFALAPGKFKFFENLKSQGSKTFKNLKTSFKSFKIPKPDISKFTNAFKGIKIPSFSKAIDAINPKNLKLDKVVTEVGKSTSKISAKFAAITMPKLSAAPKFLTTNYDKFKKVVTSGSKTLQAKVLKYTPAFATKNYDKFRKIVSSGSKTLKSKALKYTPSFALKGIAKVQTMLKGMGPTAMKSLKAVKMPAIKAAKIPLAKVGKGGLFGAQKFNTKAFTDGFKVIKNEARTIGGTLLDGIKSVKGKITSTLSGALKPIGESVSKTGGTLMKSVASSFPGLTGMATKLTTKAAGAAKAIIPKTPEALTKLAGKGAAKGAGKGASKAIGKTIFKRAAKLIPGMGLILGTGFAINRLTEGDYLGAGIEMLSGLASTIPGVGTGLSIGIDAAMIARDVYKENKLTLDAVKTQNKLLTPDHIEPLPIEGFMKQMGGPVNMNPSALPLETPSAGMDAFMSAMGGQAQPINNISVTQIPAEVTPMEPGGIQVDKKLAAQTVAPNVNVNVPKSEQSNISTARTEQLLQKLVQQNDAMINRPVHAVIGDRQIGKLNTALKTRNGQK